MSTDGIQFPGLRLRGVAGRLISLAGWILAGLLAVPAVPNVAAQELTVPEMNEQQEQWRGWASEKRKLSLSARFSGRSGSTIKVEKLAITMRPANGIRFPEGIERGQRLLISVVLEQRGSAFAMIVSRLVVSPDDRARLVAAVADLPKDDPAPWYDLAEEYRAVAEYYEDDELLSQIGQVQRDGFAIERKSAAGDSARLLTLADRSADIGLRGHQQQAVRFEAILALRKNPDHDRSQLLELIRKHCEGWDEVPKAPVSEVLEQQYRDDPVAFYESAGTPVRRQFHRRLYRAVELAYVQGELAAGRMSAKEVAAAIRTEFPEAAEAANEIETGALDRAIAESASMNRRELLSLEKRIVEQERENELPKVVNGWYAQQERELADRGIPGRMRLSEEYLFGAEHWRTPAFRERAVVLLKEAHAIAQREQPEAIDELRTKIEQLGWRWLRDGWMSEAEIANLPDNDIELAIREGRVVERMSPAQVKLALGEPSRVTRLVSGSGIRTIWLFAFGGRGGIAVHFRSRAGGAKFEEAAEVLSVAEFR